MGDGTKKEYPDNEFKTSKKQGNKLVPNTTNIEYCEKRLQTEPSSGSTKRPQMNMETQKVLNSEAPDNMDQGVEEVESSDNEEYFLNVFNLPTEWTYAQMKTYLEEHSGHPLDDLVVSKKKKGKILGVRIYFDNQHECMKVVHNLEGNVVNGKKLKLKTSDIMPRLSVVAQGPPEDRIFKHWRPDKDPLDIDPTGLYGVRYEFLRALNITRPLHRTVHVTNFRCDKTELKEVMELAGQVVMCCVMESATKYATVMYSHPLEALQAISMLNGQLFYGAPLKIVLDKFCSDNTIILPKGLAGIGQGLGLQAKPIRNIALQYQRYAKNLKSTINPIVFSEIDFMDDNKVKEEVDRKEIKRKIRQFRKSIPACKIVTSNSSKFPSQNKNTVLSDKKDNGPKLASEDTASSESQIRSISKPIPAEVKKTSTPPPNQQTSKNVPQSKALSEKKVPSAAGVPLTVPVRLSGSDGNNRFRPTVPMNSSAGMRPCLPAAGIDPYIGPGNLKDSYHFMSHANSHPLTRLNPQPFSQPLPGRYGCPGRIRPQIPPVNLDRPMVNQSNSVTVQFKNLPPSTTFSLLCEQLTQCGQLMSVHLTTPGCAVAMFGHPIYAEQCYYRFNGLNVDGYKIEVGFV